MKKTRTKFNVSKKVEDRTFKEIIFDSELEMEFFRDVLCPLVESGVITCERQVKFILQPSFKRNGSLVRAIDYKADFVVTHLSNGEKEVLDIKGFADSTAKIKKKIFHFVYPKIDYRWIGFSRADGGWVDYDMIQRGRKARKKSKEEKEKN